MFGLGFCKTPLVRDGCTACIADCYRDSSVMLHFAVSLGDALDCLSQGHLGVRSKPCEYREILNLCKQLLGTRLFFHGWQSLGDNSTAGAVFRGNLYPKVNAGSHFLCLDPGLSMTLSTYIYLQSAAWMAASRSQSASAVNEELACFFT